MKNKVPKYKFKETQNHRLTNHNYWRTCLIIMITRELNVLFPNLDLLQMYTNDFLDSEFYMRSLQNKVMFDVRFH